MGKPSKTRRISTEQTHLVMQALACNVNWRRVKSDAVQGIIWNPKDAGEEFTRFLQNGGRLVEDSQKIIPIRRCKTNPAVIQGPIWTLAEPEDRRSLKLTKISMGEIHFVNMLRKGEAAITPEERISRIKKAGYIRLDYQIMIELAREWATFPSYLEKRTKCKDPHICFEGTILLSPEGNRFAYYLSWWDRHSLTSQQLYPTTHEDCGISSYFSAVLKPG